ncbi:MULTISPECIES: ImmA/IrrE family metallo-endopeptidase [Burkholderia cepacia complex]|uniref:ImmA/IrrE family metallo-endopeptidase n=1 Tax=Burkholderia cepacia complex TaxID=87882 RepID=UPI0009BEC6C9|nr:ImmA/IrrE family metallo-endopeptidase [Burkholderia vietnamiensis]
MTVRDEMFAVGRKVSEVLEATDARHRIADGYTRIDPFSVASLESVPVMVRPLDRLLGAFLRESQPGILVNGERPAGLVHMTCAHELGHYFLGHETTTDHSIDYDASASLKERQADWFAYLLLTPRWLLAKLMTLKNWNTSSLKNPVVVYQLSLRMGVSYTGTVWSLHRQKLISLDEAKRLVRVSPKDIKRAIAPFALDDPRIEDVWLLDERDRDLILEPRVQDRFVVDLPSRISAGYMWSLDEAASDGFELQPALVDSREESVPGDDIQVGGTHPLRYTLEHDGAASVPEVKLEFHESQPWQDEEIADTSFGLEAKFESIELGLTLQSRRQLVHGVATQ